MSCSCFAFLFVSYFLSYSLSLYSFCLSKNALSFFLRDVISRAYSSSAPSSGPSSSSSAPSSSRAHSVCGVATSWAFARNASLSSILATASWSSSSVFTSFYLSDVQFSSSSGFSLGPVVDAGSVVYFLLVWFYSLFVPSLTAASECPFGGSVLALRRCSSVSSLRRRIPRVTF